VTADQLAHDEPLSPELVLVLPPELRSQALARLGEPVWPAPPKRAPAASTPIDEPVTLSLGRVIGARVAQLAVIFVAATIVTLAMSVVAHALR
jgi:hypothetical protein